MPTPQITTLLRVASDSMGEMARHGAVNQKGALTTKMRLELWHKKNRARGVGDRRGAQM